MNRKQKDFSLWALKSSNAESKSHASPHTPVCCAEGSSQYLLPGMPMEIVGDEQDPVCHDKQSHDLEMCHAQRATGVWKNKLAVMGFWVIFKDNIQLSHLSGLLPCQNDRKITYFQAKTNIEIKWYYCKAASVQLLFLPQALRTGWTVLSHSTQLHLVWHLKMNQIYLILPFLKFNGDKC